MGLGLHQHEAEVSEVVTQQRRKISFPQQLRNNQLGDGDSRPGGSGEREREEVGDEEEEEEGGGGRPPHRSGEIRHQKVFRAFSRVWAYPVVQFSQLVDFFGSY